MSLTERTHVDAATVRTELTELESSYRRRAKSLKALLRALEAEQDGTDNGGTPEPPTTEEEPAAVEEAKAPAGKRGRKGAGADG